VSRQLFNQCSLYSITGLEEGSLCREVVGAFQICTTRAVDYSWLHISVSSEYDDTFSWSSICYDSCSLFPDFGSLLYLSQEILTLHLKWQIIIVQACWAVLNSSNGFHKLIVAIEYKVVISLVYEVVLLNNERTWICNLRSDKGFFVFWVQAWLGGQWGKSIRDGLKDSGDREQKSAGLRHSVAVLQYSTL
jgi:hypothetical protein